MNTQASKPWCVEHSAKVAEHICSECGDYICDQCIGEAPDMGSVICVRCTGGEHEAIPYARRAELGWWTAFGQTVKQVIFSPNTAFKGVRPEGRADNVMFVVVVSLISALPDVFTEGIVALKAPISALLGLSILSLFVTWGLKLTGTGRANFTATFRGLGFAYAGNLLVVPISLLLLPTEFLPPENRAVAVLGLGVTALASLVMLYQMALNVLSLRDTYRITLGRAAAGYFAITLPLLLLAGGCILFIAGSAFFEYLDAAKGSTISP